MMPGYMIEPGHLFFHLLTTFYSKKFVAIAK